MKYASSKFLHFAFLVLQITAVGALDYLSGYELRLGALYAAVVGFASWYLGITIGVATSFASMAIAQWAERAGGKVYTEAWVAYANSAGRLAVYLFVAFSFAHFRRTIERTRSQLRAFQGRLSVCSCCHRVDGGDGFWMDFPTYVRKNSEVVPQFNTCPLCVDKKAKHADQDMGSKAQ